MREVLAHGPGKVFVAFLALGMIGLIAASWTFHKGIVVLGWLPLPFALGILFTALALTAVGVYMFRFWPYR